MKDAIKHAIEHAKEKCPEETCGVLGVYKGKVKYLECENISEEKEKHFVMSPFDYAKAEDMMEITHIVHSHPNVNPEPSQADLVSMEKIELPWLIVNPRTSKYTITEPSGYKAPMVGREFSFGILDCYSIIKDYYESELGIDMPDPSRTDKFWERGENLYVDNFKKAGFERIQFDSIDDVKINDVILIMASSTIANHAAIYLGDNKMLHHIQNKLSSIDVYGGYWLKNTWGIVRHKDFL
jgi:proteasome lid subunit RPN8/RPN11